MSLLATQVRAGLAEALGACGRVVIEPDHINPPCLFVAMPEVQYDLAFARGLDLMRCTIFAVTPRPSGRAALDQLDLWLSGGESGVKHALERDRSLDGRCQTLRVVDARPQLLSSAAGEDLPSYAIVAEVFG